MQAELLQILEAMVGTAAFSILFHVPKKQFLLCGLGGGACWMVHALFENYLGDGLTVLAATMVVALLSRIFAVWLRCPAQLFLVPGLFPLVPGLGIYWTTYYFVIGDFAEALTYGYGALKTAAAIVLGIVFVFEIPQSFFHVFQRKTKAK